MFFGEPYDILSGFIFTPRSKLARRGVFQPSLLGS
jgi:hypothetical protein